MTNQQNLEMIHTKGYWRINIRPVQYKELRILSLQECHEIIQTCQVKLRGWYYPHIDKRHGFTHNGNNWIASGSNFDGSIEFWKFFQSGQFIHHIAMIEDWKPQYTPDNKASYLEILGATYRLTEIIEFASRLVYQNILQGDVEIAISLRGTENRQLYFMDPSRRLYDDYVCRIPQVDYKVIVPSAELIANGPEISLKALKAIFERFNWNYAPTEVLKELQSNLLDQRR